jgi:hypothetical protein
MLESCMRDKCHCRLSSMLFAFRQFLIFSDSALTTLLMRIDGMGCPELDGALPTSYPLEVILEGF